MICYQAVEHMYDERNRLIIIGLTGRTGSGCSTVSKILGTDSVKKLDLRTITSHSYNNVEDRKNYIINKFINQPGKWKKFIKIDISSLILYFVFKNSKERLIDFIKSIQSEENREALKIIGPENVCNAISCFDDIYQRISKIVEDEKDHKSKVNTNFYTDEINKYRNRFKSLLEQYHCFVVDKSKDSGHNYKQYNLYTYLMQIFANNIRASGDPFKSNFTQDRYTVLPSKISEIIDVLSRENKNCRICIDAIRNPYEALFLRDKYKYFYLVSVNTDENSRLRRLASLTKDEIKNLDKVEYWDGIKTPEESFYHQNIQGCIEIANIHLHNKDTNDFRYYDLTQQIVRYIALILHPGLVTPSSIERCMQFAYNAKLNSGCLSRQVGAVVTRDDFSVQSVGWNDVPKGQISCNLRDVHDYCINKDREMYSQFEIENKDFSDKMTLIDENLQSVKEDVKAELNAAGIDYCDMCAPYCFKDIYQGITGEKNQVHTRALHAEENAFLQISKYGGTQVNGGFLFTTASPCELCSKKAYQLGISKIYYIDPYPGISKEHILTFGNNGNPEMILFQGAIGDSYVELYRPRFPIKDELEMRTGVKIKKVASSDKEEEFSYGDIEYKSSLVELRFIGNRTNLETKRVLSFKPIKNNRKYFINEFEWTESTFDDIDLISEYKDKGVKLEVIKRESPAKYKIDFSNYKISPDGDVEYGLIIKSKDEKKLMDQTVEHRVRFKTEKIQLRILVPDGIIESAEYVVYADFEGKVEVGRTVLNFEQQDEMLYGIKCKVLSKEIYNPNVNYKYSIEWKFAEDIEECKL